MSSMSQRVATLTVSMLLARALEFVIRNSVSFAFLGTTSFLVARSFTRLTGWINTQLAPYGLRWDWSLDALQMLNLHLIQHLPVVGPKMVAQPDVAAVFGSLVALFVILALYNVFKVLVRSMSVKGALVVFLVGIAVVVGALV